MSISSSEETAELLRETRRHFPRLEGAKVEIAPIEKGGSDRKFYRVQSGAEDSLILIKYDLARAENRHYVAIAQFLGAHGVRAPRVHFHDPAAGLIWIEDLGEADLWSYRNEDWPTRRRYYLSALEEAGRLHSLAPSAADEIAQNLQPDFDATLYLWEQQYFFEHCLGRFFALEETRRAELAALPALREIADRLAALPRVLVHRDFQSQNIIMRDGQAHLIDFQGIRMGLAEYDLASLIYDPYVRLTDDERMELLEGQRAFGTADEAIFRLCAMQRLMQALGAYGNLGLVKGNKAFLAHIPPALASLTFIARTIDGLEPLHAVLAELRPAQE